MQLSPAAAAKIAGYSRPSISKAIKNGELRAIRNNSNMLLIERADLDAWLASKPRRAKHEKPEPAPVIAPAAPPAVSVDALRLAGLEVEVKILREQMDEIRTDRDHWRDQAEKLANRPSFWAALFGRGKA